MLIIFLLITFTTVNVQKNSCLFFKSNTNTRFQIRYILISIFEYRDFRKAYITTLRVIARKLCPRSVFGRQMFQEENSNSFNNTYNYDFPKNPIRQNQSKCCCLTQKVPQSAPNGHVKSIYNKAKASARNKNEKLQINNTEEANGLSTASSTNHNHHQTVNVVVNHLDDAYKDDENKKKNGSLKQNSNKSEALALLKRKNSLSISVSSCSLDKEFELDVAELDVHAVEKFEKLNRLSFRNEAKTDSRFKKFFSVKLTKQEMGSKLKNKLHYSDNMDEIEVYRV